MTDTARLALPMIEPGQAQKELFHNEALLLIDAAVQAAAASVGADAPPPAPTPGECHIVGPAPTGAWEGRAQTLAAWTAGGWRFVEPGEGMAVWNGDARTAMRFTQGGWRTGVEIGEPAGGATIDTEARAAIAAILTAMRSHGLIAGAIAGE